MGIERTGYRRRRKEFSEWQFEVKEGVEREKKYCEVKKSAESEGYGVMWKQCENLL